MDSEEAFCYPYTQTIDESQISYTIRYPELKESENRWAMRQTAVYHCYNTQTHQSVFVLLSPAVNSLAHQRAEQYLTACHSGNLKGPFWLHDIVFSTYLPAWRQYIADLERKFLPISGTTFSTYIDKELRVGYDNLSTLVSLQNRFLQVPAILGHAIDTLKELYVLLDEHPLLRILPFETRQLTIQLRNQYSNCRAYSRNATYLQQRTQATATLLSDTLSFRDQVVAKEQNGTMLQLNKSAVFITMLTLFYLPASFVATFFGMNFFDLDNESGRIVGSSMIWIFVVSAILLTAATFASYYWLLRRDGKLFTRLAPRVHLGDFRHLARRFTLKDQSGSTDLQKLPI
ncbi:hypothetical protein DL770_002940 [Monosporascus sp. CRB-9-2]|nr:hypothetical protein DL770_002940 [Monosporascus sp. CRB-9-2]